MSLSPDLFIGELRPWPDSVHVVRGKTDEARRYTPERKDAQEALERRIDELCAEVERGKAEFKKMDVWHSQELKAALAENAKLREFAARMANALGIDSEWCDQEWCDSDCMDEFKCRPTGDNGEIRCPAFARMAELGIEVPS